MRAVIATALMLIILFLSSCSTRQKSPIDMEKWMKNFEKNDNRSKYNEQARKSIFPNMKTK